MPAQFEIRSPKRGAFTWVLTNQGRVLATGETYTRKASCEKAIASFRKGAATAKVADVTIPPPATAPAKVARAAGRVAAKAVVKGAKAVEKVEKTAAKATAQTTKAAKATKGTKKVAAKSGKRAAKAK